MKKIIYKIEKMINQILVNKNELIKIGRELSKLLSKILLLNYISKMKYVSPFWKAIQIVTKWSLYASILTYVSTWFVGLFTADISFIGFVNSLITLLSGSYVLVTELNLESLINFKFSFLNDYNKMLAKMITKLESLPNKTDDVINRIKKLKTLFVKIPEDKIVHEVMAEIPDQYKETLINDFKNKHKDDTIDVYYLEFEKLMDPEYRKKLWKEHLKENLNRKHSSINITHITYDEEVEDSFFVKYKKLLIAAGLISTAIILNYFMPEEYNYIKDTVTNVRAKLKEYTSVSNLFGSIWNKLFKKDKDLKPGKDPKADLTGASDHKDSSVFHDASQTFETIVSGETGDQETADPWSGSTSPTSKPINSWFASGTPVDEKPIEPVIPPIPEPVIPPNPNIPPNPEPGPSNPEPAKPNFTVKDGLIFVNDPSSSNDGAVAGVIYDPDKTPTPGNSELPPVPTNPSNDNDSGSDSGSDSDSEDLDKEMGNYFRSEE